MSKLTIVVCVVFFASASNAFSMKDQLSVYDVANGVTTVAILNIKEDHSLAYESAKRSLKELLNETYRTISELATRINNCQMNSDLAILYNQVQDGDVDECTELFNDHVANMSLTASVVMANANACINDKLQTVFGHIEEVKEAFENGRTVINDIIEEGNHCADRNANSTSATISCLQSVAARAYHVSVVYLPKMTIPNYRINAAIRSSTINSCVILGVDELEKQSSAIVEETRQCIQVKRS